MTTQQNRIDQKFIELQNKNNKALITFITAGDPNLNTTVELVLAMEKAGADIIELGVPFSDPVADGPIIQQSSIRALKSDTNLLKIIATVKDIRLQSQVPIVLMTYYNPVLHLGLSRFADLAQEAGVDGIIVPDLPYEESQPIFEVLTANNIRLIPLVAPTTPAERIKLITTGAKGFIYCVSLTGVTGVRDNLSVDIKDFINDVRVATDTPIAVGFGISTPEQAAAMAKNCDAVIVGSAIVKVIAELGSKPDLIAKITTQVKALKQALVD